MGNVTTHKRNWRHAAPGTESRNRNRTYPWPLLLVAAPAAVAIWSGWVGLGAKTGFGPVNLLPGVGRGFTINTAITLPVGIESYGVYAMFAWLTLKDVSDRTRDFARKSAVGALALGILGQVVYHLLDVAGWAEAPWFVVMLVSCLPVLTVYLSAALTHRIVADRRTVREAEAEAEAGKQDVLAQERAARDEAESALEAVRAELAAAVGRAELLARKLEAALRDRKPPRTRKRPGTRKAPAPEPEPAPTPEPAPEPAVEETVDIDAEARILQLIADGHSASEAGRLAGKSDSYGRAVARKAKDLAAAAPEGPELNGAKP